MPFGNIKKYHILMLEGIVKITTAENGWHSEQTRKKTKCFAWLKNRVRKILHTNLKLTGTVQCNLLTFMTYLQNELINGA